MTSSDMIYLRIECSREVKVKISDTDEIDEILHDAYFVHLWDGHDEYSLDTTVSWITRPEGRGWRLFLLRGLWTLSGSLTAATPTLVCIILLAILAPIPEQAPFIGSDAVPSL